MKRIIWLTLLLSMLSPIAFANDPIQQDKDTIAQDETQLKTDKALLQKYQEQLKALKAILQTQRKKVIDDTQKLEADQNTLNRHQGELQKRD